MNMKKKIIILAISCVLTLVMTFSVIYYISYKQTLNDAVSKCSGYSINKIELIKVSPSRTHVLLLLWKIHFKEQTKYPMYPCDLAYWRLKPYGDITYTK